MSYEYNNEEAPAWKFGEVIMATCCAVCLGSVVFTCVKKWLGVE